LDTPESLPLTKIEIEAVLPELRGFALRGRGQDRVEYRVDLQFELPLDARTRVVLGELLTQATVAVSRLRPAPASPPVRPRRDGAHKR
jgi:hypothetical protein